MADSEKTPLHNDEVVTKYQVAADITNRAIKKVADACVAGAKVLDLCVMGDQFITEAASGVYSKARDANGDRVTRGVAFPTSINVNNIICHFSPLSSDPESELTLKDGDVVKIELGAHIDGFPALVAHTLVVGASKSNPVTGKTADVMQAAYTCAEAALRLLKPEHTNYDVTDLVQKIAKEEFEVVPLEGMLSHEMYQHVLDGEKQILLNPSETQRKQFAKQEFAYGDVFAIDVLITSSEEAKARPSEARTTIFKRVPDATYQLKMQTSRKALSEATSKHGFMAFNLRTFDDAKKARMGFSECIKHNLIIPYDILEEKDDKAVVAQFLFTVLLMPSGNILKITQPPFDQEVVKSDKSVKDAEIQKLLSTNLKGKKKASA